MIPGVVRRAGLAAGDPRNAMIERIRESFLNYFQRGSLRRRLAYSLAIVRLILVPVIFLAVYYLFIMGRIVDRIVTEDAPAATLAQQGSIQMLVARRAERTFLLSHDSASIRTANESLSNVQKTLNQIQDLRPQEQGEVREGLAAAGAYAIQFQAFEAAVADSKTNAASQVQSVVRDYETSINAIVRDRQYANRARLIDELRTRASSFDDQITKTIQASDPALLKVTTELQSSGEQVLQTLSALEEHSWSAVQQDHREARQLLRRAEWTLSIVSGLTFLLSVWISFVLPRQIVQPLLNLKQTVDHAITDDHEPNLNIHAEGELGQLADSVLRLIAHLRTRRPVHKD